MITEELNEIFGKLKNGEVTEKDKLTPEVIKYLDERIQVKVRKSLLACLQEITYHTIKQRNFNAIIIYESICQKTVNNPEQAAEDADEDIKKKNKESYRTYTRINPMFILRQILIKRVAYMFYRFRNSFRQYQKRKYLEPFKEKKSK